MVNLDRENNKKNAKLLLQGMWYSNLPDLLDIEELSENLESVFFDINLQNTSHYEQDADGFIKSWRGINSPPDIRKPGVEALSFFDFKKNKSLREMQIPNLLHYLSFIYNTLFEFKSLFHELYLNEDNFSIVSNSNSYLVFDDTFVIHDYEVTEEGEEVIAGVFTTKNNKINNSAMLSENRRRSLKAELDYLYSLKMDIESFFPSLYTHNFEKIIKKSPFCEMNLDSRYFIFLDNFHQRINNNQTKGIPAGIFSSHIAAELCMLCIDAEIRTHIVDKRIGYIRYVDDLTFFSDSERDLDEMLPIVQNILNRYRLRINGHKTEQLHAVRINQPTCIGEINRTFPCLIGDTATQFSLSNFYELKRYIHQCLTLGQLSQIRALLSIFLKRISDNMLDLSACNDECLYYFLKLVYEDETLVCHIYRLVDILLSNSTTPQTIISTMLYKRNKIDSEYPDTLLQIWHYHVMYKHSDLVRKRKIVDSLQDKIYNPLIVASMVSFGDKTNHKLFAYIRNTYIAESHTSDWKSEIMYSKWWLPLFKISRYDSYNYDKFMKSLCFPDLLKKFPMHIPDIPDLVDAQPDDLW